MRVLNSKKKQKSNEDVPCVHEALQQLSSSIFWLHRWLDASYLLRGFARVEGELLLHSRTTIALSKMLSGKSRPQQEHFFSVCSVSVISIFIVRLFHASYRTAQSH